MQWTLEGGERRPAIGQTCPPAGVTAALAASLCVLAVFSVDAGVRIREQLVVCVGVDQYDPKSGLPTLQGAVRDARAACPALTRAWQAGGRRITTRLFIDREATPHAVREALLSRKGKPHDILFYYSGHALPVRESAGLAPYGATLSAETLISASDLAKTIVSAGPVSVTMILDTEHSPVFFRALAALHQGPVFGLGAAQVEESAIEDKGHGIFTHALVKELRPGIRLTSTADWWKLGGAVVAAVRERSKNAQTPSIFNADDARMPDSARVR